MLTTVSHFDIPKGYRLAEPSQDDRERVMDRRVFYEEPELKNLISSLGESSRAFLRTAMSGERSHLPLFPAHLLEWNMEGAPCGTSAVRLCSWLFPTDATQCISR
jgi:hypothetical protein